MAEDALARRHMSAAHLELLAQYMERFPDVALARARGRDGLLRARRVWDKIARTLNRIEDGVHKDGKNWARYWADLKFKIRRKYMLAQKCAAEGSRRVQLSPFERRMAALLTDARGRLLSNHAYCHVAGDHCLAGGTHTRLSKSEPKSDTDSKIDDSGGTDSLETPAGSPDGRAVDQLLDPDPDIKPNIQKQTRDPIEILLPEEKKSMEELRRELLEFELKKQRDLHEMELQQRREKHEMEMAILRLKRQMMMKELKHL